MTAQEKLKILHQVLKEGFSVSSVCRQNKISRKTFYIWKKKYLAAGPRNKSTCLEKHPLRGLEHPRGSRNRFKKEILRLAMLQPELGSHTLSQELRFKGQKLGNHGVYTLLKELGLETFGKRREFASLYRSPLRFLSETRKRMVEEVVLTERRMGEVASEFKVSRKTLWKWIKRYQKAQEIKIEIILALNDQNPTGSNHPKGTPAWLEEKILAAVARNPEYSTHKLAQIIPEIGNHGIQNVLLRNSLNTFVYRKAYAQLHVLAPQIQPVTNWLDRIRSVWETFVPSMAPAPPPSFIKIRNAFFTSLVSSSILSLLLLLWLQMMISQPASLKLGLFFASISLIVGSFFFAYSMKYYLTLAIVLSFSRQTEERGGLAIGLNGSSTLRQAQGSGWLQRIFGLSGSLRGPTSLKSSTEVGPPQVSAGGLQPNLDHIQLTRYPFVSIHLPFYNEKKVAERILVACTSMDYPNYEVIVCDDSTDETTTIVQRFADQWNRKQRTEDRRPIVKIIHRETREGFKGGALKEALKHMDSRTEFVIVFDADFIPYPDTIEQFLKYFKATGGWEEKESYQAGKLISMPYETFSPVEISPQQQSAINNQQSTIIGKSNIACVAGYQWHVLNKSENWITRGVRTEYAGSYVIERPGQEILSALKIIHGSVYMIRADVLKHFGWGTSITEDFELTLRIYEKGFKVVYTPYVQAPSECVSTIKRLIRQRMRWSEGHSFNVRRMFVRLLLGKWEMRSGKMENEVRSESSNISPQNPASHFSPHTSKTWVSSPLTLMEKLELLYISPYYLQAAFFLLGTFSWLISETVFKARLPFWTSLWGWSLVLTNFFALPLVNAVGLFLEESEEKDYLGLLSFVALSYLLVPFQAYASVKGFLEKQEGPWFRTPKTGLITDIFTRGRFYRWIAGIIPGRIAPARISTDQLRMSTDISANQFPISANPYLALATANSRFNDFKIRPRHLRWLGNLVFTLFIFLTSALIVFAPLIPLAQPTLAQEPGKLITVEKAMAGGVQQEQEKLEEITTPKAFHFSTSTGETLEMIFHQEPRVRVKLGEKELEITTQKIGEQNALPKKSLFKGTNQVVYEEIIPGVDLVYSLNPAGFEEKFVVKRPMKIREIQQLVIPKEVKVINPFADIFGFYDEENQEVFKFQEPLIYEEKAREEKSQGIKITLEKNLPGYTLKKTLTSSGAEWLSSPQRSYPVVIDPSVIVSGGIVTSMVKYGGNQRKLAYMPGATGGAAWYAVREDGAADLGNIYFYKSTNGTSWSGETSLDTEADCNNQRSGPSIWVDGNLIYVVWNSRNCITYDDRLYFRPIDTANSDTLGTRCYSADLGTIAATDINSIAKVGTTVYTINDNDPDFMTTTNLATCTGGTNWAVTTIGHGVTAGDRPVLDTNGTDLYVFFQDGQLSFSRLASGSWTPANLTVSATTSTRFSAANDGTTLYLVSIDSATSDINLHICTISTACNIAGEWPKQTSPWTGLTNPNTVSVTLNPSAGHVFVSVVYGTAGSAKAYFMDSVTSSISWTEEYDYGWTVGTVEEISSMYSVTDSTKIGVVLMYNDGSSSDFEFATVPEKSLILLLLVPFLPGTFKKLRKRRILWKRA